MTVSYTHLDVYKRQDVKNLTDGLSIAKKYLTHTQMTIGAVLLGIAVLILLIILIRSPKYRGKLKYKVNIPLVLRCV